MPLLPSGWTAERRSGYGEVHHLKHDRCEWISGMAYDLLDGKAVRQVVYGHECEDIREQREKDEAHERENNELRDRVDCLEKQMEQMIGRVERLTKTSASATDFQPGPEGTITLSPEHRARLEAIVVDGERVLTREQITEAYDHELPEEMGEGPFVVFDGVDDGTDNEPCSVAISGDYAFCLTCEAQGHLDGYLPDAAGVERWHRDL